jgi:hypothetical protein
MPINPGAGRGDHLKVTVRLGTNDVPFVMDTGASVTVLDKSLEPKLGKLLGTSTVSTPGEKQNAGIYGAPEMFLGGARLALGSDVFTYDFKECIGILGMDCLQHYCIQLDFSAGKMRFLEPAYAASHATELGKAFTIPRSDEQDEETVFAVIQHAGLFGKSAEVMIDTGCNIDGLVGDTAARGRMVILPECRWEGGTYTNLVLASDVGVNVLGLGFLGRHIVTLDFPGRTVYFKQVRNEALRDDVLMEIAGSDIRPAARKFEELRKKGELPDWSNDDTRPIYFGVRDKYVFAAETKQATYLITHFEPWPNRVIFNFQRAGDSETKHFAFHRTSSGLWELRTVSRTDQSGRTLEEFSVPSIQVK